MAHDEGNRLHGEVRHEGNGASAGEGYEQQVQRAEELVDRAATWVGHYAGVVGQGVLRLAARAREEAEDFWAEAQSIRRGEHFPERSETT